jgi:2'-5' RNA ligase
MTIADHWWWRPGWHPGRRMYTWHITFAGMPTVHDLAARTQARLAGLPGLDLVPARWLHLTMQGVGFTDEVSSTDVASIVEAAQRRLTGVEPARVRIGPAQVASEGVILGVAPIQGLTRVRDGLRAAIADIWPTADVPESADWAPHVSVAYSRISGPDAAYRAALSGIQETADVIIDAVHLIVLGRDERVYDWLDHARVGLGAVSP